MNMKNLQQLYDESVGTARHIRYFSRRNAPDIWTPERVRSGAKRALYNVLGANVGYDMPGLNPGNEYAAVKADVARALKGDFGLYSIHREYMPIEHKGKCVTARNQDFDIYIPADLPFGREAYVLAHEFAEAENLRKSGGNELSAEQHIQFETYVLNALNELRLEGDVTAEFAYQAAQDMRASLKADVKPDTRTFYSHSWNNHRALNRMGMHRN